jgi:uncharacterized protein YecE (DUF72 family)
MPAAVHIGTSGWHYKHSRGPFYPEKLPGSKMLEFYAQQFDTVELNSTFYRLPPENGVRQWRAGTPDGFCFAAKGSRFLTHMKKLADPATGIERYFKCVDLLGPKLGPVLFQLPPFWERNTARLDEFLAALPPGHSYAFEFRNHSWHCDEIYAVLKRWNAAWCSYHLAGFESSILLTADFTYIRLHGPEGPYQGSYSREALETWARRIEDWRSHLRDIYIYFDNDVGGYAPRDALLLKSLCHTGL